MRFALAIIAICMVVSLAFVAGGIYHTATGGEDICSVDRRQTQAIRNLIIKGTERSRAFEQTFKDLGLPPYEERLAQAHEDANSIPSCP